MEGMIWLVILCTFAVTALLALGYCRRLLSHDLPEQIVTLALLESREELELHLDALAAQLTWTDRDLVQVIWLVDGTPDSCLEPICTAFCQQHSCFRYCRLSELVKIFGKMKEPEKNDCNSSKKQV